MIGKTILSLALWVCAAGAWADATKYPDRSVKVVVGVTPGSGADSHARYFSDQLSSAMGQSFIVENKPGAGGVIAGGIVKSAPADGYTIFAATITPLGLNKVTMKGPFNYDSTEDLKPVGAMTKNMTAFLAPADSPLNSVADIVNTAKAQKNPMNVGFYGQSHYLSMRWFGKITSTQYQSVQYGGAAPMMQDLMGGRIDWAIGDLGTAGPLAKGGKLKILAVTGDARHADYPGSPTVKESGYPEYVNYLWNAFYVRADTPDDITAKLAAAMQKVHSAKATRDFLAASGAEPYPVFTSAMRKVQLDEVERYRRIATEIGYKPE